MEGVLYICDENNKLRKVQIEVDKISVDVCNHVLAISKIVTGMAKNKEYGSLEDVLKQCESYNKQAE